MGGGSRYCDALRDCASIDEGGTDGKRNVSRGRRIVRKNAEPNGIGDASPPDWHRRDVARDSIRTETYLASGAGLHVAHLELWWGGGSVKGNGSTKRTLDV